ncbi:S6 family peptidase [Escherichia coli]|uniref:S6 family peptidase n=1 Tax=Escherichia coli TaxID=562 RepID=UPI000FA7AD91|nr:S6 family peptidase [Escherichia coli]EEC7775237.1 autotransporter outer membrane beta-barrel domain-containing protein [Escherichia coli]EFG5095659.1 autotransporter outer membrane beta-barrel domain-containing protein [Escherichia coli]EFH7000213.1 autotransporter outer membrane beta-barrel domain-containing protein [Escherichia coli]EGM8115172.1 autotransporter outer membrane beta-barrel domain-containing protein [Escherichia coli]EGM9513469.1 autotransporter outer membrane beta-barrel d
MNKIYNLKYSKITNSLIAVPEFTNRAITGRAKNNINKKFSAILLFMLTPFSINASTVSSLIDYQIYRDFAENKGQFQPGAKNITIYKKDGTIAGILNKAPMPDFKSVDRQGIATLVDPQYVVSVKHNVGYQGVTFGGAGNNPDYNHYNYNIVDRNNHGTLDFHAPRLNKLVTEVAPTSVTAEGAKPSAYTNKTRYPVFYRIGSGTQYVKDTNNKLTQMSGAYSYLTGGTVGSPGSYQNGQMITSQTGNTFNPAQGPLASYGEAGDSGSPLFAYDTTLSKWVLVGVLTAGNGPGCCGNNWAVVPVDWLNTSINFDKDSDIIYDKSKGEMVWSFDSSTGIGTLTQNNSSFIMHGKKGANDLNAGKNITFTGDAGEVVLNNNVNQGAGSLTFNSDYTIRTDNNSTWVGAGLIVNDNANVKWQVNGQKNDALHKIGKGTLHINGSGINEGDLRVGDGTVVLNQKTDTNGNVQAFNKVTITSGRPTVVLSNEHQVKPDNIYFGFRGGRLDLNGNDISLARIKAADSGATIVNHNADKASSVTLTGKGMNNTNNNQVFLGFLGEKDSALTNGKLNINYRPPVDDAFLALTGGANVNGSLNIEKGNVLLSGAPILHANNKYLDDWNPSAFIFSTINVDAGKGLQIGQYASVNADITAKAGSHISVGYNYGDDEKFNTRKCTVNDNTGVANCSTLSLNDNQRNQLPYSSLTGDIKLADKSAFSLGKAIWTGALDAETNTYMTMASDSVWKLSDDSRSGSLTMNKGSGISLSDALTGNIGNTLTIKGNLQGEGDFSLNTRMDEYVSDRIVVEGQASGNYTLNVLNSGGEPIQDGRMLTLMSLTNPTQDFSQVNVTLAKGHVDIGTWRYRLTREGEDYKLYNPVIPGIPLEPSQPLPDDGQKPSVPDDGQKPSVPDDGQKPSVPNQQSNWISRESNTAISNFTSHFNLLNKQAEGTQRHISNLRPDESGWWFSFQADELKYGNKSYRPYTQKLVNQTLGVDWITESSFGILQWGGALSTTVSDGRFDEGIRTNDSMNGVNLYGKLTLDSGVWFSGYAGIHYIDYSLKDSHAVKRGDQYGYVAGIGLGYDWQAPSGFTVNPQAGISFYGLPSQKYSLNNNDVSEPTSRTVQYYSGLNISRDIDMNGLSVSPYSQIMHRVNANPEYSIHMNGNKLNADLEREQTEFTVGNRVELDKSLVIDLKGEYTTGGGLKDSKGFSLDIRYTF